jgi:hypothetical protein
MRWAWLGWFHRDRPGVVHPDVDTAEPLTGGVDGTGYVRFDAHIANHDTRALPPTTTAGW